MKKYCMNNNCIKILQVLLILLLIVMYIVVKYYVYTNHTNKIVLFLKEPIVENILLTSGAVYILYVLIYLPIWCKGAEFYIYNEGIGSKTGILFKSRKYISLKSIQSVTFMHVPFSNRTGFNFIRFSGYGSRAVFILISQKDAYEIVSHVKNNMTYTGE